MKYLGKRHIIFRTYNAKTFEELYDFAKKNKFQIVDEMFSYDKEHKKHVPTVELY